MRRLLPIGGVFALALAGCPPPNGSDKDASVDFVEPGLADGGTSYAFCPTRIDVYGGIGAVMAGCGGEPAPVTEAGLWEPGDAGYDATLAGRLQARLAADPQLAAKFGTGWVVRSCARPGWMGSYVRTVLTGESCSSVGNTGDYASLCATDPSPLVLYGATNAADRCHGGELGSPYEDDESAYAEHWSLRFEEFRAERDAGFVIVSPQTEWYAEGSAGRGTCQWSRPAWNVTGGRRWRATHAAVESVRRVGELQATYLRHHPCCAELDAGCSESWFPADADAGLDGWTQFDCQGAAAMVDFWYAEARAFLLNNRFTCP